MRCTTLTTLLTGVMLYLGMGALVFVTLETPKESSAHKDLLRTKQDFLINNSCITELDFHKLVKDVVSAVDAGLDVSNLSGNLTTRWDWASAFFFCGTIITTIGFGNLSPRTWFGQLFCVCYALVGIPMFGILLAGVGDHMGTVLRRAVAKIEKLFLKRKVRPTTVRVISAVLSILIGCLIFLAVPTVVFQRVEKWSFLESLYFVVITLTTVGFGDFVPGGAYEGGSLFKPLVLLWIVFGLAYFASILTMIGNWLRVLSKKTRAEMEELRAHATDWTQNMSMDFKIPNPLEFNDPFLLQRRRWKRSERRRIRRGAQYMLGHPLRVGAENGHLPNHWAVLSSSMSQLEAHFSADRTTRPRMSEPGELKISGHRCSVDPAGGTQGHGRSSHHLLARSFSLPVTRSTCELDSAGTVLQDESLSGLESAFDSRSDSSSLSLPILAHHKFCSTINSMNEGGGQVPHAAQENDELFLSENTESVADRGHNLTPCIKLVPYMFSTPPSPHLVLPSSSHSPTASSSSCELLAFFGENLAYIDESSDTLSDATQPAASEEKRRRPRKPKRRSAKKQLSHTCNSLQVRRPSSDMQPPSNPPTPPPDLSQSDLLSVEIQTDSVPNL